MSQLTIENTPARKKGLFKRAIDAMNFKLGKTLFRLIGLPMMAFLVSKGAMAADDLMAAGREDAEASFGEDSTLIYYFMLAEVVLVFLMYLRNHNPATFVLIPVFFVITGIIFAIIRARAPGVTP
ncbi:MULTISPECIES: type IV conjugative transfer system pilin TraA [Enterobacterales]|uniref:Pilin n=2 Tax=Providencia TaxID=586 RepID=A0A264VPD3_PRORE|nr:MULTISPECIES: type IV conjugative transfer system pilin TraA [Providencia]ELT0455414.1 conjugal transfer protein TraA [Morganella morganii]MCJ4607341.1 conjugal transfer protein TraA [Klebsiella pneumoniae]EJD6377146.1 conjugal transfer protein TraA [Providencia rettgeri]ELR5076315.1 conjugal transfer protein TraA [Providencia rettgeri]ELR5099786.1 conjugal transfer protein TraA [Providencia rettgeri]